MACKDGFSSGHEQLRDLALANLEEKRKELEKLRRQVEDEIQRFQNEIQRIQSQIQRSEGDLDRIDLSLKENRAEYGKIVNASSALLNLPTEVTCMIFELSSSTHNLGKTLREEKSPMLPEVVISHVCTKWRDVALSCASLWTRFYFSSQKVDSTGISNIITQFDTYLKRSGSRNLELFLDFAGWPRWGLTALQQFKLKEHEQLLDMAIKHINRWKTVTLLVHQDMDLEARLPSLLTGSAPELEYFVYSSQQPDYSSNKPIHNPLFLQGGAPKLRHFQLNCSPLYIPPSPNVTTLHIALKYHSGCIPYSWKTFLAILSMPLLANLTVIGEIFRTPEHKPIVNMNNLKHLRYCDNGYMADVLSIIRAPLLKTLVVCYDDKFNLEEHASEQDGRGIEKISYFFPSLETLVFLDAFPSPTSFAWRIPLVTSNIENLIVCISSGGDNGYWPNERVGSEYWPKLTSISFLSGLSWNTRDLQAMSTLFLAREKLNVRLCQLLHSDLQALCPHEYEAIEKTCNVEVLNDDEVMAILDPTWPHGFNTEDPLRIECFYP